MYPPSVPIVADAAPVLLSKNLTCWLAPPSATVTKVPSLLTWIANGETNPDSVSVGLLKVPSELTVYLLAALVPDIIQRLSDLSTQIPLGLV